MSNLRAVDINDLPLTTIVALSDSLVSETSVGTRTVELQVLFDVLNFEFSALTIGPTTPPPTTPAVTTPPPTTPPPTTPAPTSPPPTTGPTEFYLTVDRSGSGDIIVNGVNRGSSYITNVAAGTPITIDTSPDSGWEFDSWSGDTGVLDDPASQSSNSFTMPSSDVNLTADFDPEPTPPPTTPPPTTPASAEIDISQTSGGPGAVGSGGQGSGVFFINSVLYGTSAELLGTVGSTHNIVAEPNSGSYFVEWKEDGVSISTDASLDYEIPSDEADLVATFTKFYVVAFNPDGPTSVAVGVNGTWDFSASAFGPGNAIDQWRVRLDGNSSAFTPGGGSNAVETSATMSFSSAGSHYWTVEAYDIYGNFHSVNWPFTVT